MNLGGKFGQVQHAEIEESGLLLDFCGDQLPGNRETFGIGHCAFSGESSKGLLPRSFRGGITSTFGEHLGWLTLFGPAMILPPSFCQKEVGRMMGAE